ncbi:hypothetical protein [Kibdelosporangium aridum]|uniref:hypothetical protein n=1 Tax=Kibdelosporangium aridum TaxID=2030 RepID=UPI0035E5CD30
MSAVPLAFVHHANQLNITDGYDNRDGVRRICDGYAAVLDLHRRYGIPTGLHLSGTLIEAALWHRPGFVDLVNERIADGTVSLLGGTYSEPVMPACSQWSNRRQLATAAELNRRHFGVGQPPTGWLPERVWAPELAEVLSEAGIRRVLVDDRLLAKPVPKDGYPADSRAHVDLHGPYRWDPGHPPPFIPGLADLRRLRPAAVTDDLTVVPICSYLRYLFPPRTGEHLKFLEAFLADVGDRHTGEEILVYADDMERAAGVGGWEPALERYEELLRFLAATELAEPIALDPWLDERPRLARAHVPAGTYYELEVAWSAGPSYRGWTDTPQWWPYGELLADVECELLQAGDAVEPRLRLLAERMLLLGQHELGWQDNTEDGQGRALAPWVRATASHARLARPLLSAARWSAGGQYTPSAGLYDIDGDGAEELIMVSDDVWCLIAPREGARVTLMAHRRPHPSCGDHPPALIVGNPADHWNFQEELHRYMDVPAAHPGALADSETAHRAWIPWVSTQDPAAVVVDLRPEDGTATEARRYALLNGVPALLACIHTATPGRRIENLIVPDYLEALLGGRAGLTAVGGQLWRGWQGEASQCWLAFDPGQATVVTDEHTAAGHGLPATVTAHDTHVDLLVGAGFMHDSFAVRWLAMARDVLHPAPPGQVRTAAALAAPA